MGSYEVRHTFRGPLLPNIREAGWKVRLSACGIQDKGGGRFWNFGLQRQGEGKFSMQFLARSVPAVAAIGLAACKFHELMRN
jgi:hypothetical protein